MTASKEEILEFIETTSLSGYQNIPLPYNLEIPGKDHSPKINSVLSMELKGKSVLDIGCYYGLYSHEAKKRGAGRVVGIELNKQRAEIAQKITDLIGDGVEIIHGDILDVNLKTKFDVILFLSVLHHIKEPVAVMKRLASICSGVIVIEFCLPEHRLRRKDHDRNPRGSDFQEKINDHFRSFILRILGEKAGVIVTGDRISSDQEYDWTYFYNLTAFRTIFQVQNALFSDIRFEKSPQKQNRMLAFCKV